MARKTSSSGPQHFCNRDLADLKPFARTDAVYQRRNGGGVVAQSMSAYPGRQAHRVIAEFRKLLDTCNGWSRADNGVSTTYTLSPIAFPPVGEDSVAARLNTAFSFKQRPVTITTDFVMLRVGNVVMYLGRTAPVGQQPSSAALASLAQIAAHRVTAA
jgi:hypothetical protein